MSGYRIDLNPRCSKSRETLALLEEKGIQPTIELYLQQQMCIRDSSLSAQYANAEPVKIEANAKGKVFGRAVSHHIFNL